MRLDRALDRFDGDLARRNCSPRSRRDYFWHLRRLFEHLPPEDPRTDDLTQDVIRDCLDAWADALQGRRDFSLLLQVAVLQRPGRAESDG